MKKLLVLVALLGFGVCLAGCGETKKPAAGGGAATTPEKPKDGGTK